MKPLPVLAWVIVASVLSWCMACKPEGSPPITSEPELQRPPMDSSLLSMHPDLLLGDSLLNNSYDGAAHDIYVALFESGVPLKDTERRLLMLRLALTSVTGAYLLNDSVYQAVVTFLNAYSELAASSEMVPTGERAEYLYVQGRLSYLASYVEADKFYQEAVAICVGENDFDQRNAQRLLSRIGRDYLFHMEWANEALEVFRHEEALLNRYAYPSYEWCQHFHRDAVAYLDLGQFELAESAARNATRCYRQHGGRNPEDLLLSMVNMVYIGRNQRDTLQIGTYIDSLIPMIRPVYGNDTFEIVNCLTGLISCTDYDLARAGAIADTAIRLCADRYPFMLANVLRARAYVYNYNGLIEKAREDFLSAIDIIRKVGVPTPAHVSLYCDALLGLSYVLLEKFNEVEGVAALLNEAIRLHFGVDDEKWLWEADVPAIVHRPKWPDYLSTYQKYLYKNYLILGDTASLRAAIRLSVIIDSILVYDRRKAMDEDVLLGAALYHDIYSQMIAIAQTAVADLNDTEAPVLAFRYMERSRAYLVESEISFNEAARRLGVPDSLLKAGTELAKAEGEFFASGKTRYRNDEWNSFIHRKTAYFEYLEKHFHELHEAYLKTDVILLDQLRSRLPDSVCVLEYQVTDDRLFLLGITADTVVLSAREFDATLITSVIDTLSRGRYMTNTPGEVAYLGSRLHEAYDLLVAPAREILDNISVIYVIPDGILQYIPFEALLLHAPETDASFKTASYLFGTYHIGYALSGETLHRSLSTVPQYDQISAFAYYPNRSFIDMLFRASPTSDDSLPDLPGALREASGIQEIFRDREVRLHLKEECTSRQFFKEAAKSDVLHLGIHAFANRSSRFGNALVFGDSTLHAIDLIDLDLQARLVVLSACETGSGKQVRGEGLFNFARPFIAAGADEVVMSRWLLHDQTVSLIMQYFYTYVHDGQDATIALSNARRRFFSENANNRTTNPYYWSLMCTQ